MVDTTQRLMIISAPSGAGKTTLCKMLLQDIPSLTLSVSFTTRSPRGAEEAGKDYHFVDGQTFEGMVEQGELAEWASVHGNLYGTGKGVVREAAARSRDVLFDIDWQGALQLKHTYPEAFSVFILPPSMEELGRRLRGRGTDSEQVINRRVHNAQQELLQCHRFDYLVINEHLESALQELMAIYQAEGCRVSRRLGQLPARFPTVPWMSSVKS